MSKNHINLDYIYQTDEKRRNLSILLWREIFELY